MVLRHIQGLVLQEIDQLGNAFAIDATLAKHHFWEPLGTSFT